MKKQVIKNKAKNKNTNRINVTNTIKIGNNKKRSYRKRNQPSSGAPIIVNVPQSFPQPYYTPSQPFHTQPPYRDAPTEIKNPTKPVLDDMKRDSINAISEIPNIPHAIPITSKPKFKDISHVVPHVSSLVPVKDEVLETPSKGFDQFSSSIKDAFKDLKSRMQDIEPFELHPNITDNRRERQKNSKFTRGRSEEPKVISNSVKTRSKTGTVVHMRDRPTPTRVNPDTNYKVRAGGEKYKELQRKGIFSP